jgi:hypothetical protein
VPGTKDDPHTAPAENSLYDISADDGKMGVAPVHRRAITIGRSIGREHFIKPMTNVPKLFQALADGRQHIRIVGADLFRGQIRLEDLFNEMPNS